MNWVPFLPVFVIAETEEMQRGSHWAKDTRVLVSELGSRPRSVLIPKLITLNRISTGSSLESPQVPIGLWFLLTLRK